jgi:hypothetical protein
MSSSRPWVKVWESWWTSRSHADLSIETLGIGARIMSLVGASPDQDGPDRWCLRPDGKPLSLASIARECRVTVGRVSRAINDFVAVGTMARRDDGAIGFPNWDPHQLSPSALRMRKWRHTERHSDADSDAKSDGRSDDKRTEDRGQSLEQHPPNPPKPGGRKSRRSLKSESEDDLPAGLVDEVLELMRHAVRDVTRGRDKGPQDCPGNRELIRVCTRREAAKLEDWRHVIRAQAESVRHDQGAWRYLALSTITRRTNWLRLLDAPMGRSSNRGPVDPSSQDHSAPKVF